MIQSCLLRASRPETIHAMPRISISDVEQVALLARLALTEDEKVRFCTDLNVILEHFEALRVLDTSGVVEHDFLSSGVNRLREDSPGPSLPREEVLREAPGGLDEYFVVPRVVDA